jgi:hypothetical protein
MLLAGNGANLGGLAGRQANLVSTGGAGLFYCFAQ